MGTDATGPTVLRVEDCGVTVRYPTEGTWVEVSLDGNLRARGVVYDTAPASSHFLPTGRTSTYHAIEVNGTTVLVRQGTNHLTLEFLRGDRAVLLVLPDTRWRIETVPNGLRLSTPDEFELDLAVDPWPRPTARLRIEPTGIAIEKLDRNSYRPVLTLRVSPPEATVVLLSDGNAAAIVGPLMFLNGRVWRNAGTVGRVTVWTSDDSTLLLESTEELYDFTRGRVLATLPGRFVRTVPTELEPDGKPVKLIVTERTVAALIGSQEVREPEYLRWLGDDWFLAVFHLGRKHAVVLSDGKRVVDWRLCDSVEPQPDGALKVRIGNEHLLRIERTGNGWVLTYSRIERRRTVPLVPPAPVRRTRKEKTGQE